HEAFLYRAARIRELPVRPGLSISLRAHRPELEPRIHAADAGTARAVAATARAGHLPSRPRRGSRLPRSQGQGQDGPAEPAGQTSQTRSAPPGRPGRPNVDARAAPPKVSAPFGRKDMPKSRAEQLLEMGQSVWLDYIRRGQLVSGEFDRLV